MSDKKKPGGLSDILSKVKAGAATLGANKPKPGSTNETEPTIDSPHEGPGQAPRPVIDDFDDPLLIDTQDQASPEKTAKKTMSTKKKVVLAAVVVCAAVMAKTGYFTPGTQHHAPANDPAPVSSKPASDFAHEAKEPEKGLDVGLPSLNEPPAKDPAVGQTLDQLQLDGPFQKPLENHQQTADLSPKAPLSGDGFGFPAEAPSAEAAPLNVTAPVPLTTPAPAPVPDHVVGGTASPFATAPTAQQAPAQEPADPTSLFGAIPTPTPAKIPPRPPVLEKGDPVLGSTPIQNPDSSPKPSQQTNTADVKKMEAQLAQKDQQIKVLEKQLASKQASKPAPAKHAVATLPKQSPVVAQRSSPRAITPVAKVAPRPKLCVKAVAPPARNCITCVAHAFVVDAGAENMVGQGDFLDGYRVSITGDRLDLQNSDGQVVHKFWSQPNGCPSI